MTTERLTDDALDHGAGGSIRTTRFETVRYWVGYETGDVFGRDCGYDGATLTIEVADAADAQAMLDAISGRAAHADDQQREAVQWWRAMTDPGLIGGPAEMSVEPARRFAEEACELLQSCSLPLDDLIGTARWVYAQPAGSVGGEIADAGIMLSIIADQRGLSVSGEMGKKLPECRAKIDSTRAKWAAKPRRFDIPADDLRAAHEALEWYGEQARLCRLIHCEGDAGRNALAADGGKRARDALSQNRGAA